MDETVPHQKPLWREAFGSLVATIVVLAYVAYGFVTAAILVVFSVSVAWPQDWSTTMGNMAMAALGVLIGQNLNKKAEQ